MVRKKKRTIALLDASRGDPNRCLGTVVSLHDNMPDALMSEIKLQALQDIPRTRIVTLKRPLREGFEDADFHHHPNTGYDTRLQRLPRQ